MSMQAGPGLGRWRDAGRPKSQRPTKASKWWRVGLFGVLTATTMSAAGLILYYLFIVGAPERLVVPFWVERYDRPEIKPPAWAAADRNALETIGFLPAVAPNAEEKPTREVLRTKLGALRGSKQKDALVLSIVAQSVVGDDGKVQLLASDSDYGDPESLVPLAEVLDAFENCPTTRKLLILDVMRPLPIDGYNGLVNVADRIVDEVLERASKPMLILTACGTGQVAAGSEALGCSVFNHILARGLAGEADLDGNEMVFVKELADYLARSVDAWTRQNLAVSQRPLLLGGGKDFPIGPVKPGAKLPAPLVRTVKKAADAKESAKGKEADPKAKSVQPEKFAPYPSWLARAWTKRDAWRAEQVDAASPRLLRIVEAALLDAELQWRRGVDSASNQRMLETLIDRLKTPAISDVSRFHSLGEARAAGWTPDPALDAALKEPMVKWTNRLRASKAEDRESARNVAIKPILDALKNKSSLDFVSALAARGDLVSLEPETLLLLGQVMDQAGFSSELVEMRFLRDLARAAGAEPDEWPTPVATKAWETQVFAEEVLAQPADFSLTHTRLDQAETLRHDAHFFLTRGLGYVSRSRTEDAWRETRSAFEKVNAVRKTIRAARHAVDVALSSLPACSTYIEASDNHEIEGLWLDTADAAHVVLGALESIQGGRSDGKRESLEERIARVNVDLKPAFEKLQSLTEDLLRPFQTSALEKLAARCASGVADPVAAREIEAVLSTALPEGAARPTLLEALGPLEERLATLPLRPGETTAPPSESELREARNHRAGRRARRASALLRLAGLPTLDIDRALEVLTTSEQAGPETAWDVTNARLHAAWKILVDAKLPDRDPKPVDRAGWIAPVAASRPSLESSETARDLDPVAKRLVIESEANRDWLSRRFGRLGRDLSDPTRFYEKASLDLADKISPSPSPYVTIVSTAEDESRTLSKDAPLDLPLRLEIFGPPSLGLLDLTIDVEANRDDPRLDVSLSKDPLRLAPGSAATRIAHVVWNEDRGAVRPIPRGFIVAATVKDGAANRVYHAIIPLAIVAETYRPRLVVSADANSKTARDDPSDSKVRPNSVPKSYFVHVRNPSPQPRELQIEIVRGEPPTPLATAKLLVEANTTTRVRKFETPAQPVTAAGTPPPEPFTQLTEPLSLELRDAVSRQLIDRHVLAVEVATPTDYVDWDLAQFVPKLGIEPNELTITLRARPEMTVDPCPVQLALDKAFIPRLNGEPIDTKLSDKLIQASEVRLHAKDIPLLPSENEEGSFQLHVDGVNRALWFKTRFLTAGRVQRVEPDRAPRVRFRAWPVFGPDKPARLKVLFETDNAPKGTLLVFRLDRELFRAAAKRGELRYDSTFPGGAIVFRASVSDWDQDFDIVKVRGRRTLEARLVDDAGVALASHTIALMLDDEVPVVQLGTLATRVAKGTSALEVMASAHVPASGFREVDFFVGKPADFDKLRSEGRTSPVPIASDRRGSWSLALPLDPAAKGRIPVSVRVMSGVGLVAFQSAEVEIVEPKTATAKAAGDEKKDKGPGAISGRVVFGTIPQPDLEVSLYEYKDKPILTKKKAKTGDDGKYLIKDLPPGAYIVYSVTTGVLRDGQVVVVVQPGETAKADDIELTRPIVR